MRILEPRAVTILVTSNCTAACRHCCMNAGPTRQETLDWPKLESILDALFAELELEVIVFSGGEPTLLGETLLKALRKCRARGVGTRMVTNAYWATSMDAARAKLQELRAAGLTELNISTDDYHLPFISLQRVSNAFHAALELDFAAVVVCNVFGPESWLTPDRLAAELGVDGEMTRRFEPGGAAIHFEYVRGGTLVMLSNAQLMRLGTGNTGLAESELKPNDAEGLSALGDMGGCPWAVRSAAISPKGHFVSCCGFEVEDNPVLDYGDLATEPLEALMDRADNDLLTNLIAWVGPVRLKDLLERVAPDEAEFERPSYRSICEVCQDLVSSPSNRQLLMEHGPMLVDHVLEIREVYAADYADGERVRVPTEDAFVLPLESLAEIVGPKV